MKSIPVRKINTPQKELNLSESFNIRVIQSLLAGKDMVEELHRHDFFYILALKIGKGNHIIDFTSYKINNYSVFFMRPGQVHQLSLKAGSTGYLIGFTNDFYYHHDKAAAQLLRKVSNNNLCQLDSSKFKKIFFLLTYIFQEYSGKKENYLDIIKANLNILFIELCRHSQVGKPYSGNSNRLYQQETLEHFSELLEAHISTHKQVSQYASMLNISSYQLNAITKSVLNKTCSQLIDEYIILEGKRYLLATSNQVNQVALYLGYDDASYFIRFFKKHAGYSPEVFRQNFK